MILCEVITATSIMTTGQINTYRKIHKIRIESTFLWSGSCADKNPDMLLNLLVLSLSLSLHYLAGQNPDMLLNLLVLPLALSLHYLASHCCMQGDKRINVDGYTLARRVHSFSAQSLVDRAWSKAFRPFRTKNSKQLRRIQSNFNQSWRI